MFIHVFDIHSSRLFACLCCCCCCCYFCRVHLTHDTSVEKKKTQIHFGVATAVICCHWADMGMDGRIYERVANIALLFFVVSRMHENVYTIYIYMASVYAAFACRWAQCQCIRIRSMHIFTRLPCIRCT